MKGCLCVPTGPAMAKEVATPMMKRNCISTVSYLCCTYLCLWPLPNVHTLHCSHPSLFTPHCSLCSYSSLFTPLTIDTSHYSLSLFTPHCSLSSYPQCSHPHWSHRTLHTPHCSHSLFTSYSSHPHLLVAVQQLLQVQRPLAPVLETRAVCGSPS